MFSKCDKWLSALSTPKLLSDVSGVSDVSGNKCNLFLMQYDLQFQQADYVSFGAEAHIISAD